jgi:hypothetical protein
MIAARPHHTQDKSQEDPMKLTPDEDRGHRMQALRDERDQLEEWQNTVAARMGDNFDGEEGQEYIIDRWLDLVEERLREADPAWHRYLFQSGPDPRNDDDPLMDIVRQIGTHGTPREEAPPEGPLPWRPL